MPLDKTGQAIKAGDVVRATVFENGEWVERLGLVQRVRESLDGNLEVAVALQTITLETLTLSARDVARVAQNIVWST